MGVVTITKGVITERHKSRLVVRLDLQAFYDERVAEARRAEAAAEAEDSGGDGDGDDEGEEEEAPPFDPLSMERVAMRCSDFKAVKSMLQTLIEEAGHKLQLSPKYHAKLAGQGI